MSGGVLREVTDHAHAHVVARELAAVCAVPWRIEAALIELLYNAIEHGRLGIGAERKATWLSSGEWAQQCAFLQARRPAADGRVEAARHALPCGGWRFEVRDQGSGFDWQTALARQAGPSARSGRGLALAANLAGAPLCFTEGGRCVAFEVLPIAAARLG